MPTRATTELRVDTDPAVNSAARRVALFRLDGKQVTLDDRISLARPANEKLALCLVML
jgi:hypothetical protein